MHTAIYVFLSWQRLTLDVFLHNFSTLFIEIECLTWHWNSPIWLIYLASSLQASSLWLQIMGSWNYRGISMFIWHLHRHQGFKIWSSHFAQWAISPAPIFFKLSLEDKTEYSGFLRMGLGNTDCTWGMLSVIVCCGALDQTKPLLPANQKTHSQDTMS